MPDGACQRRTKLKLAIAVRDQPFQTAAASRLEPSEALILLHSMLAKSPGQRSASRVRALGASCAVDASHPESVFEPAHDGNIHSAASPPRCLLSIHLSATSPDLPHVGRPKINFVDTRAG